MWDSSYASNRTVSRIFVQTQLFRMTYTEQNMSEYRDTYTSLFSQLDWMGKEATIPESHQAPMLLASIEPQCRLKSTADALRTKHVDELTWDYVAATLIDGYNARCCSKKPPADEPGHDRRRRKQKSKKENAHLSPNGHHHLGDVGSKNSDIARSVHVLSAALKSVKTDRKPGVICDFLQSTGSHWPQK